MSIFQEILNWSNDLPSWQSDAIARLFSNPALSGDDLDDLFALLKAEHGIPDPKGRTAKKLNADQIPPVPVPNTKIKLVALKNFRHVNRIAENQRLPFSPNGLTLIYGDNGSGKSGYSRVLKRACRARDQSEPIHPNAFLPFDPAAKAEATFEIEVNGKFDEAGWVEGQPAPAVLSSIALFDSRCARSYLDSEGDFAYVPYGLDILEGLATVCKRLKVLIEAEFANSTPDKTSFEGLVGDTSVGRFIENLSYKTKTEEIEALATVTPEEMVKHGDIGKIITEGNPKVKATQLRLGASRVSKIAQNAIQKVAIVNDIAVTKLRGLVDSYQIARAAADLAARTFKERAGFLPGTGGDAWKDLFEAARKFSVEAHVGKHFPDLGPDAQCPLCQQPLAEGAKRLLHFEEFIQQEAEKTAQARKRTLADENTVFVGKSVSLGMENELFAEIQTLDEALALDTRAFETALSARHVAIKGAINTLKWDTVQAMPLTPAERLQGLADKLNQEASTLEQLTNERARATLQAQFTDLDARIRFAKVKAAVLIAVGRLYRQAKLTECLSAVKTNAISLKASDLIEKVVSKELEDALNGEFKCLGVTNLKVVLKSRSDKGKSYHKLKLDLPQAKAPGDILSEGEQRAIAIGSFLAEVNISGSSGGIIFDDPVSSLDHIRRERVARRLAQEADKRQVIIFTHDLYFLNLLVDEAQKANISFEQQSVTHRSEGFGVPDPDIPFEGMNTKARVGYLRNKHPQIKKLHEAGEEREHRKQTAIAYWELRFSWERAIEEVLLRSVVLRFRKGVETKKLAGVQVEDADYVTVDKWMTKCSNYSHDQAMLGGLEVPDPDELLEDINALEKWRAETYERSERLQKKRKAGIGSSTVS